MTIGASFVAMNTMDGCVGCIIGLLPAIEAARRAIPEALRDA